MVILHPACRPPLPRDGLGPDGAKNDGAAAEPSSRREVTFEDGPHDTPVFDRAGLRDLVLQTFAGNFIHIPFLFFPAFYMTQEVVSHGGGAEMPASHSDYGDMKTPNAVERTDEQKALFAACKQETIALFVEHAAKLMAEMKAATAYSTHRMARSAAISRRPLTFPDLTYPVASLGHSRRRPAGGR